MRLARRRLPIGLAVLLLAGCAVVQPPREPPADRAEAWDTHRERLESIDGWHAEGRLSVRMGNDGANARFDWREIPDGRFSLRLSGAWGQGVARLTGGAGEARLDTGEGRAAVGPDAANLLARRYGWDVPVDGLRRWLLGLPTATVDDNDRDLDRFGRLETLVWQDWEIHYRRYQQVGDLDLPAVLIATRTDGGAVIRIAVDHWQPGTDPGQRESDGSGVPLIGE